MNQSENATRLEKWIFSLPDSIKFEYFLIVLMLASKKKLNDDRSV